MGIKKHFKLYKSGKQWVTAAVATAAISTGLFLGGVAQADQQTPTTAPVTTSQTKDSTLKTDQSPAASKTPQTSTVTATTSTVNAAQQNSQNFDHQDQGNYGNIDTVNFTNNGQLHVTGWQATNAAQGKDNRFVIVRDTTTNQELGGTQVENVSRPDVQRAHNVYNAANSGFNAIVNIDFSKMNNYRDSLEIVARYSGSANGNSDNADFVSQPVTFDRNQYGNLDKFAVNNGELHVVGWNATNQSINLNHHFILLYDQTAKREVARQEVQKGQDRPDVAKVYPNVINAGKSGFDATFNVANLDYTHQYQIISRYSNAANGEGTYTMQWFNPRSIAPADQSNQGYLDSFDISKAGEVTVSGWHATDLSTLEGNHYVILYDQTAGRQVASAKVTNSARPDVASSYRNVKTAGQSGFQTTFKLTPAAGHQYSVVSRYSTDSRGNGNNGKRTDLWLAPVTLNQSAANIDNIKVATDGIHVKGWMISDNATRQRTPYAIVLNNGKEITRQKLNLTARKDVARVYPSVYNSLNSGFDTTIHLTPAQLNNLNGQLQVLLRFSTANDGNPSGNNTTTDQVSRNYQTNAGNFDYVKVNGNQVEFSGWRASDQSANKPAQWLIVLVNGQEVKRQLIGQTKDGAVNFNRNDVYNVYPELLGSAMSGFQGVMTLPVNIHNQNVQLIHRYSDDLKHGEGNYIDFASPVMPVNGSYQLGNGSMHKFGLQTINGKQYYVDMVTNQPRKNFLMQNGNEWLYFDKDTGAAVNALKLQFDQKTTSPDSQIKQGTTAIDKEYAQGNQAYSYDNQSIENVNGFLTADSWYRPKQILKNGTTWTDSTATDMRPLLMTWWPNQKIEVDYLNYMQKQGLSSGSTKFTVDDSYNTLSTAAENVQQHIEEKIGQEGNTNWLRTMMNDFIKTESIWNEKSENVDYGGLQLQGGFLKYVNSDLTKYANSDWRLLNRTATNINGKSEGGAEFLLADDVDNSNPVVQAEDLNWLHYLMNFGTITGNNPNANFDGIRVDAVDNVDVDLLSIARDYFNAAYGMEKSDANANKHLNILEDWGWDDPAYLNKIGNPQLTMDDRFRGAMMDTLAGAPGRNQALNKLITQSLVNRANDSTENAVIPSYTFVRAHDSNAQDQIRQAIQAATNKPYGEFNLEDEKKGMALYIQDQNSTKKMWNLYNMPSMYALMLTNKDSVPRVYYGDLFQDGGQYMEHKTRYYPTITNLLKTRIKYIAGGQSMAVDQNGVLTSVRYGKGAMTAKDLGTNETRHEGIGLIISNNARLNLKNNQSVVLHMGAAHRNQQYRAAILTTANGVVNYTNDANAPIAVTDANGDLHFYGHDLVINDTYQQPNTAVKGYANPDVNGYLAVWVPVGAAANQDARTAPSTEEHTTKTAYRANAALDSNVIFEGFSNFIYWPTESSERTNVRIAQNTDLFKSWGITSFEMAPQYNSSKDGTFLDSTIDNGYAFTDRYDLGMSTPNKYGSDSDLRNALEALHKAGIQAIADWVPDQVYNLTGKEAVTVTRCDDHGRTWEISPIKNTVYIANSIGGGEYQKKYGGEFLDTLQKQYPELFKQIYPVTGTTIDPSVKIKQWSAKYLNGTNILHRGSGYVLRSNGGNYYNLGTSTKQLLPSQLTGQNEKGFVKEKDGNYYYYDLDGVMARNSFIQDSTGNWYYFDENGKMVTDKNFIRVDANGTTGTYLFLNNGVSFRSGLVTTSDGTYYFDGDGRMVKNQTIVDGAMTYVLDANGKLVQESYDPSATEAHPLKPGDLNGQK